MLPFDGPLVTTTLIDRAAGRAGSTTESAIAWYARWVYDIEYTQEEASIAKVNLDYHHVQIADSNRTIADPSAATSDTAGITVEKEKYTEKPKTNVFGHVYWMTSFFLVIFPTIMFLVLFTVLCGRHCREEEEYYQNQPGAHGGGWQNNNQMYNQSNNMYGQNQPGFYGGNSSMPPAHAGGPYQGGYDVSSAPGFTGRNSGNNMNYQDAKYGPGAGSGAGGYGAGPGGNGMGGNGMSRDPPDFTRGPGARGADDPFGGRGPAQPGMGQQQMGGQQRGPAGAYTGDAALMGGGQPPARKSKYERGNNAVPGSQTIGAPTPGYGAQPPPPQFGGPPPPQYS